MPNYHTSIIIILYFPLILTLNRERRIFKTDQKHKWRNFKSALWCYLYLLFINLTSFFYELLNFVTFIVIFLFTMSTVRYIKEHYTDPHSPTKDPNLSS